VIFGGMRVGPRGTLLREGLCCAASVCGCGVGGCPFGGGVLGNGI
jgi:hypothetical protein